MWIKITWCITSAPFKHKKCEWYSSLWKDVVREHIWVYYCLARIPLLQKTLGPKTLIIILFFLSLIIRLINLQSRFERRKDRKLIGHFPREIFRVTKYLTDRGANMSVTLTSDHYQRSPLVQGGMEIPCKVKASISGTCINLLLIERYKKMIEHTYTEPQNKEILGCYLNQQKGKEHPEPRQRIKKKALKRKELVTKDIWNFFAPVSNVSSSKRNNTNKAIIEID